MLFKALRVAHEMFEALVLFVRKLDFLSVGFLPVGFASIVMAA